VSLILIVIIKMIFGTELHYVGSPEMLQGGFPAPGNLPFPWYRLFLILLSILLLVLTYLLFFRTRFGLAVRAVRRNRSMSAAMGINTTRVDMLIFGFGSGLAGVAGAVLAPIKTVSPTMGFPYAVDSFMVLVLGGVGNLLGVPVGAAIIGEGETILSFLFNSVIGKLLVFLLIVLVIRIVPRGIFGYQERTLGHRR
jgi:urea transport system permease protein